MTTLKPKSSMQLHTERKYLVEKHDESIEYRKNRIILHAIHTTHSAPQSQRSSKSKVNLLAENRVQITDLKNSVNIAMEGEYFLCRSIVPPFRMTALATVVDDPEGEFAVRLVLYNFTEAESLSELELVLPVGTILVIKNPFFKATADGGYSVRCDNPGNIIFIGNSILAKLFPNLKWQAEIPLKYQSNMGQSPGLNLKTHTELRVLGNNYFKEKNYPEALKAYTRGLDISDLDIDLLANRCATYLNLERFQDALNDAEAVLKIDAGHLKVLVREVRALCGLRKYQEAVQFMEAKCAELKEGDSTRNYLDKMKTQIQQQLRGEYDMRYFLGHMGKRMRFVDSAEFVGKVNVVNIAKKGRGLVATEEIKAGQLIMVCKAFAIVFPDDNSNESLIGIDGSSKANLVSTIVNRLIYTPELGNELYKLYAGPELNHLDAEKGDDCSTIDMNRILGICKFNVFEGEAEKSSSSNLLMQQDYGSGLWILPSFLNHCCLSNSVWYVCGDFIFVRACKDISFGEEITIQYVSSVNIFENRTNIFGKFELQCDCPLCNLDKFEEMEIHHQRKQTLEEIKDIPVKMVLTSNQMTRLQNAIGKLQRLRPQNAMLNYCIILPQTTLAGSYFALGDFIESAEILERVHALCDSTLFDIVIYTAMNIVAAYMKSQQIDKAKEWSKILKQNLVLAYGSTDPMEVLGNRTLMEMKFYGIHI